MPNLLLAVLVLVPQRPAVASTQGSPDPVTTATQASPRDAILGDWEGTSTCVGNSKYPACADEVVIYHVVRSPTSSGRVMLTADKIVGGKVETMGTLEFTFDDALEIWTSEISSSRVRAQWSYRVNGSDLAGTLVELPSRELIRKVVAKRR